MACCEFNCIHKDKNGDCNLKGVHKFCTWRSCAKESKCESCKLFGQCEKREE